MKILFDHQIFSWQRFGGISRYFYELAKHLKTQDTFVQNSFVVSFNHYIAKDRNIPHFHFPHRYFKGRDRLVTYINKQRSITLLKKGNYNIFHPTYYDPYFLPYLKGKPFVLTIYDMIHEKYTLQDTISITTNKAILARAATKIIAISHSTKKDIIEILGIAPSKIEVIHLASDFNATPSETTTKLNIPLQYILFVGARESYKNFEHFARAFTMVHATNQNVHLVCAGQPFNETEQRLLQQLKIATVTHRIAANDNELKQLYTNALLFVFPSLYEGFGIPILEAFACNCPVALSNSSSFPEVAGDAAIYFDPQNVQSIAAAICSVLENKTLQNKLIESGKKQASLFSWQKTAEETLRVYKNIVKQE